MYRLLAQQKEVRERRPVASHPVYAKPELLATAPNQVWSWDITKLKGPVTWTYFYLYVILDIFSRNVVGWMVAERESAELAKRLIDFCSGLTYALDGGMQRVGDKIFLLTPRNVEVSAEERARLIEKGFFNQF